MQKLTKAWNKAPAGTPITADPAELASEKGVVLVDAARFAYLAKHGFFRARKEEVDAKQAGKSTARVSTVTDGAESASAGNETGNVPAAVQLEAPPPPAFDEPLTSEAAASEAAGLQAPAREGSPTTLRPQDPEGSL